MGGTEKKIRCSVGAPKKKFSAPICVAVGVVGRWCCGMGQNWGNRKKNSVLFLGLPGAPKKNFGSPKF